MLQEGWTLGSSFRHSSARSSSRKSRGRASSSSDRYSAVYDSYDSEAGVSLQVADAPSASPARSEQSVFSFMLDYDGDPGAALPEGATRQRAAAVHSLGRECRPSPRIVTL